MYVETIGNIDEKTVKRYIEKQMEESKNGNDQPFLMVAGQQDCDTAILGQQAFPVNAKYVAVRRLERNCSVTCIGCLVCKSTAYFQHRNLWFTIPTTQKGNISIVI